MVTYRDMVSLAGLTHAKRMSVTEEGGQAAVQAQIFMPSSNLPPPKALTFDDNLALSWRTWKQAWKRYEIATGVNKQECIVRVSTLLSVISEDSVKAHDTFTWNEGENQDDIALVLQKFDYFCAPRMQVIYER